MSIFATKSIFFGIILTSLVACGELESEGSSSEQTNEPSGNAQAETSLDQTPATENDDHSPVEEPLNPTPNEPPAETPMPDMGTGSSASDEPANQEPASDEQTSNDPLMEEESIVDEAVEQGEATGENDVAVETPVADLTPVNNAGIEPVIKASRISCASPCTVVFSAEDTTAAGHDEHEAWALLSYYWDFDTDETDTYGALYNQNYSYTAGDTSYEAGHVPMVTKTFLCEVGTCVYNVGLRAQDVTGNFGDDYQRITVRSESAEWGSANTICISNSLNVADSWESYDKPCPSGATKQNVMPDWDAYDGKLILFKKGDVFTQDNVVTHLSQKNYKMGYFGNDDEPKPELFAQIKLGYSNIAGASNAPTSANMLRVSSADIISAGGFPENITLEGLRFPSIRFPMSYQHIGIHNIDMDYETSDSNSHGQVSILSGPTVCHGYGSAANNYPDLDCADVPFPKGGYISAVDIVGGGTEGPGINLGETQCAMVNYLGIVDTRMRKTKEHNVRIAGWYRLNIMRSFFAGQHALPGKQKLTLRSCVRSGGAWISDASLWIDNPEIAPTWQDDIEGRNRTDAATTYVIDTSAGEDVFDYEPFLHESRYQVVAYNQLGDNDGPVGVEIGTTPYQTNATSGGSENLYNNIMISHNIIEREPGTTSNGDIQLNAINSACIDNDYWNQPRGSAIACISGSDSTDWNIFREPILTPIPSPPGS